MDNASLKTFSLNTRTCRRSRAAIGRVVENMKGKSGVSFRGHSLTLEAVVNALFLWAADADEELLCQIMRERVPEYEGMSGGVVGGEQCGDKPARRGKPAIDVGTDRAPHHKREKKA